MSDFPDELMKTDDVLVKNGWFPWWKVMTNDDFLVKNGWLPDEKWWIDQVLFEGPARGAAALYVRSRYFILTSPWKCRNVREFPRRNDGFLSKTRPLNCVAVFPAEERQRLGHAGAVSIIDPDFLSKNPDFLSGILISCWKMMIL